MTESSTGLAEATTGIERVVARVRGREAGPTLLALGGIHGNEPSGVLAARNVVARIEREASPLRGDFVALAGNTRALARGVRFLERDLNRDWTQRRIAALREAVSAGGSQSPWTDRSAIGTDGPAIEAADTRRDPGRAQNRVVGVLGPEDLEPIE